MTKKNSIMTDVPDEGFSQLSYEALSQSPTARTHRFDPRFYREPPSYEEGYLEVETPFFGDVDGQETNQYKIHYTVRGDKGPLIWTLHGVPTNEHFSYGEMQELLSPFCRFVAFDMLGMGKSSMPLNYGKKIIDDSRYPWVKMVLEAGGKPWDWVFDSIYLMQIHEKYFNSEKMFFIADDWGGGILSHFTEWNWEKMHGAIWINPISFDGYPVSEIQAIGRSSQLSFPDKFMEAMGSSDQTMVQIFKTMVYDSSVWNQYSLRDIKKTYFDVDYERSKARDEEDADSLSLRLHPVELKVLADRAAILSPALLLPRHDKLNPRGVTYSKIKCPCKVIWGREDDMMPERQRWKFVHCLRNAECTTESINGAGHFSAKDKPDEVAESIMSFIMSKPEWRKELGDVFLGLNPDHVIYKGDERHVIDSFRLIYNI